jgi:HEAT repeat protein
MLKMLTDYMEGGFLENIISLFRKDEGLYPLIGGMLADERGRVRLGTIALVETMMSENYDKVLTAIPGIGGLLENPNPTIRGDAAHLLGIIGHKDALPYLKEAAKDEHEAVREAVQESIDIINSEGGVRL